VLVKFRRQEPMARDCAHRSKHARIFDAAALKLLDHHPLARIFEVDRHRNRHYTDPPAVD
jgi:hypothetical protein